MLFKAVLLPPIFEAIYRLYYERVKLQMPLVSSHHVCAGLVLVQPGGFVLDQLLSPVAYRRPATARLLGWVDQTFAVCCPGTGGVEDLARLHPSDFPIIQQVSYKILTLMEQRRETF